MSHRWIRNILQDNTLLEDGAVENEGFKLSSFSTDIHFALLFHFKEVGEKLTQGFAQMFYFEAKTSNFDDDSMDGVINHFLNKPHLFSMPQISQWSQSQSFATE